MTGELTRHCPRCNAEMYRDKFAWYCSNATCGYETADPVTASASPGHYGVQITAEQREQIQRHMAQGDLAEAQRMILDILKDQFVDIATEEA